MDKLKELWLKFSLREKICLIVGALGSLAIVALLLSSAGAVEKVLPYVLAVGAIESVAAAGFFWDRDKKRAICMGVGGAALCIAMLLMLGNP